MRIVLLAIGSRGDVDPLLSIGRRLRKSSDVLFVTLPPFADSGRSAGLETIAAPADLAFPLQSSTRHGSQSLNDWRRSAELVQRRTRWVYSFLRECHVPDRTVVIARSGLFGARIAREILKIGLVTVHHTPAALRSRHDSGRFPVPAGDILPLRMARELSWRAADWIVARSVLSGLNQYRGELGLRPVSRLFDRWASSPDLNLGLFPDWFASPQPDWPRNTHLVGFPVEVDPADSVPAEVNEYLSRDGVKVAFTRGSHGSGNDFVRTCGQACELGNFIGLFLGGGSRPIGAEQILHCSFAPLARVLSGVNVLVHHGGAGTTALALYAGVPQVIIPGVGDQWEQARRIDRLGLGMYRHPRFVNAARLAAACSDLIKNKEVARRCMQAAARLSSEDGIGRAAKLIESIGGRS